MGTKLRLKEVSEQYGRSVSYWRKACDRGAIRHFKDGDERIIDSDDVEAYWGERAVEPTVPPHAHPIDAAVAASNANASR